MAANPQHQKLMKTNNRISDEPRTPEASNKSNANDPEAEVADTTKRSIVTGPGAGFNDEPKSEEGSQTKNVRKESLDSSSTPIVSSGQTTWLVAYAVSDVDTMNDSRTL